MFKINSKQTYLWYGLTYKARAESLLRLVSHHPSSVTVYYRVYPALACFVAFRGDPQFTSAFQTQKCVFECPPLSSVSREMLAYAQLSCQRCAWWKMRPLFYGRHQMTLPDVICFGLPQADRFLPARGPRGHRRGLCTDRRSGSWQTAAGGGGRAPCGADFPLNAITLNRAVQARVAWCFIHDV